MESTPSVTLRGFTIIEMIVVLAIVVLLTAVVVTGQNDFNKTLILTDTAYTVALSVRQAQTYGLSSRSYSGTSNAAYGIHIASTSPKGYQMFADVYPNAPGTSSVYCPGHTAAAGTPDAKPGNCLYDATQTELVQNYTLNRGFFISDVCGKDTGGVLRCTSTSYLTGVDILFLRPNTDSIVTGLRSGGNVKLTTAQIVVSEPTGVTSRYICVSSVGQVSVATTTCP
jgi:prepilin-type N-terminal cleavage/methylation domain-containing protein